MPRACCVGVLRGWPQHVAVVCAALCHVGTLGTALGCFAHLCVHLGTLGTAKAVPMLCCTRLCACTLVGALWHMKHMQSGRLCVAMCVCRQLSWGRAGPTVPNKTQACWALGMPRACCLGVLGLGHSLWLLCVQHCAILAPWPQHLVAVPHSVFILAPWAQPRLCQCCVVQGFVHAPWWVHYGI